MPRVNESPTPSCSPSDPARATGFNWVGQGRRAAPMAAAEQLLRQALRRDDSDGGLRLRLGGLLYDQSRFDEALTTLGPLSDAGDAAALRLAGLCLLAKGDFAVARPALAAALGAGVRSARSALAAAIAGLEGPDAAASLCRQALRASPDDAQALDLEARRHMAAGRPDRLVRLCLALQRRGGRSAAIQALLLRARAAQGDDDAVRERLDDERLLSVTALAGADNTALASEILGHVNRVAPHRSYATKGGRRVDDPLTPDSPSLLALAARIRSGLDLYLARLAADRQGTLAGYGGEPVMLKLWALVMDEGAFEDWHLHPSGLVSGVYYVQGSDGGGLLEFGLVPIGEEPSPPQGRRLVTPQPGCLVMFPSSFAHRTTPVRGRQPRISVAFDVVRA